jgi:hypothetical protein
MNWKVLHATLSPHSVVCNRYCIFVKLQRCSVGDNRYDFSKRGCGTVATVGASLDSRLTFIDPSDDCLIDGDGDSRLRRSLSSSDDRCRGLGGSRERHGRSDRLRE